MLRTIFHWLIDSLEQQLGESMDYLRRVLNLSMPAFLKFGLFMPMAQHRNVLPPAAYHLAGLISTRAEDCGPCVQMVVNQALEEDVSPEILEAALTDQPKKLPSFLRDVYDYATAVAIQQEPEPALRERLMQEVGEEGLMELSLGMASAQVFPITKRGLGYARSCRLVDIELGGEEAGVPTRPLEARETGAAAEGLQATAVSQANGNASSPHV